MHKVNTHKLNFNFHKNIIITYFKTARKFSPMKITTHMIYCLSGLLVRKIFYELL